LSTIHIRQGTLACAKNVPFDLFWGYQALRMTFRDISFEVRVPNQFGNVGASSRVAEKTLGEEEDKLQ
jgi:hypothetical protein